MKHITTLKQALSTGLGLFLVTGLTGCEDKPDKCKKLTFASQEVIDECTKEKDKPQVGTGTSSHSSGFFAPIFSSTHSGGSVSEGHSSFGG